MKFDDKGKVDRARSRWTPKGCFHKLGVDYTQFGTFAPVARKAAFMLFFCIAVQLGLKVKQWDVTKAFTLGKLDGLVVAKLPPGVKNGPKYKPYGQHTAWQLTSAVYGLKQSANALFKVLSGALKKAGYTGARTAALLFAPGFWGAGA